MSTRTRYFANPWWIVVGATVSLTVAQATISFFTYGLFFKPLNAEFGWTRGQLSSAISILALSSAVATPILGNLMDRWGVKRALIPIVLLFALSTAALGLTTGSIVVFSTLMAVTGFIGSGQGPLGYVKCVSAWFDERRGVALGIAICGTGLGATMVPQLAQFLIEHYGWRWAYVCLAVLLLVVALPSIIFFLREPTESPLANRAAATAGDRNTPIDLLPGLDIKDALKSYRFWTLGLSIILVSLVVNGMAIHTVPLLIDHGYSPAAAAALIAAFGISQMTGRLISGFVLDFIFAPFVAVFLLALACGGIALLGTATLPIVGIIAVGLCSGSEGDLIGYLTSRYFGLKRFGQIYGYMFAAFSVGVGIGPFVMGAAFERFQSYGPALIGFAVCLGVAAVLTLSLGSYRYPGHWRRAPKPALSAVRA